MIAGQRYDVPPESIYQELCHYLLFYLQNHRLVVTTRKAGWERVDSPTQPL